MTDTEELPRRKRRFHLHLRSKLTLAVLLVVALAAAFFLGSVSSSRNAPPTITSDLLSQRLAEAEELVSVEYYYTNMGKFEHQMDFYGWKVPFTTKSFIVSYDGVIKAGVDLAKVQVAVDEAGRTVTVRLPQSGVISHEIPEDTIQVFDETHNIFNQITISDYTGFTRDQKAELEAKAVENGLLARANEKAGAAVESLLDLMPGMEAYTLKVTWPEG